MFIRAIPGEAAREQRGRGHACAARAGRVRDAGVGGGGGGGGGGGPGGDEGEAAGAEELSRKEEIVTEEIFERQM